MSQFLKLRQTSLCRRITLREHKKYGLWVSKYSLEAHLGTFYQNSKPKGANFDILHFWSFLSILLSAFSCLKPIEFHNSLHQMIHLYILKLEKNTRLKLNGGILANLHFLNANYSKCLNFLKLRLALLCRRITLREHKKYALRVTNYS